MSTPETVICCFLACGSLPANWTLYSTTVVFVVVIVIVIVIIPLSYDVTAAYTCSVILRSRARY